MRETRNLPDERTGRGGRTGETGRHEYSGRIDRTGRTGRTGPVSPRPAEGRARRNDERRAESVRRAEDTSRRAPDTAAPMRRQPANKKRTLYFVFTALAAVFIILLWPAYLLQKKKR